MPIVPVTLPACATGASSATVCVGRFTSVAVILGISNPPITDFEVPAEQFDPHQKSRMTMLFVD